MLWQLSRTSIGSSCSTFLDRVVPLAASYDSDRHASLDGYRDDLVNLLHELELTSVVLVGHSVSAMIGVLLQIAHPDLVDRLVLVTPSARYLNDTYYDGGFSEDDVEELLELMSRNHLGWQDPLATIVAGDRTRRSEPSSSRPSAGPVLKWPPSSRR